MMSQSLRKLLAVNVVLALLATLSPTRTAHALDQDGVSEVVTALQSLARLSTHFRVSLGLESPSHSQTLIPAKL